jgi:hypothetical protein
MTGFGNSALMVSTLYVSSSMNVSACSRLSNLNKCSVM